jgi:hypothetical protein
MPKSDSQTKLNRQVAGVFLATAGTAALALALLGRGSMFGIVVAVMLLLLAADVLSQAGRISSELRPLVGKRVKVTVWGAPLVASAEQLELASASSFGAGLLLRLRVGTTGPVLLKIAQPKAAMFEAGALVIPDAAYVQWAGSRLPRVAGHPALLLQVIPAPMA